MVTQQFIFGVENPQTKLDFPLGPAEAQPSKGIRKPIPGVVHANMVLLPSFVYPNMLSHPTCLFNLIHAYSS